MSETTNQEDKGQNRTVIEWMRRVDPDRSFLVAGDRTWTYGESLTEVEGRLSPEPRLSMPSLAPGSVFDVVAGLMSGGVTVVGPSPQTEGPESADLVVFTSGSSGPPKGVRLTIRNLEAAARASSEHLGHDADDNWLLAMPMHHVGGLSIVIRQLYSGGSVTLLSDFDPAKFARAMREVTMVSVVPTMLRRIVGYGPFDGLRAVLVGGGPIPDGLLADAARAGLPVLPTYGMTETFGQVATLSPDAPLERRAHPLPGIDIRIEDDGRIAVRGDQVSPGYAGEPDRRDPWFVTSDVGELDDEGALRVIGRADTVIVTGGENVSPENVEAILRDNSRLHDVAIVGVPDDEWGSRVVCVYVGDISHDDLREWSRGRLPGHMVPKEWRRVDEIPKTSIGKPDREAAALLRPSGGR